MVIAIAKRPHPIRNNIVLITYKMHIVKVLACGGSYDAPAGFIDFPVGDGTMYDHSLSCDYTISVEPGKVVNITFTQFNLEGGAGDCSFDWLTVFDGPTSQVLD